MGTYVDPDKMVAARKAGASPWELHERACAGEFAQAQPYDPRVLLSSRVQVTAARNPPP